MKLSDKLKTDHECGDFGKALEGYFEEAQKLEFKIAGLQAELFSCYYSEATKQGAAHEEAKSYARNRLSAP